MNEDNANLPSGTVHLNEFQARRLRVTCEYIDKLLADIETTLAASTAKAAFPRYVDDVAPAQRRTAEDYIQRIRAQLLRVLDGQGIRRGAPSIPASRSIHVALGAISIAAEELKPDYMRGYGTLSDESAAQLNGIAAELHSLATRLDRYIVEGEGRDLGARLESLERSANDIDLLSKIEKAVTSCGLVEFRPGIAAIIDRAEDKSFEIAVFGRVSSGKSSLLNAILETDVSPVGVTPVTAVPVRVAFGDEPLLVVSFANAPAKRIPVSLLPEFATEQTNPGNAKGVSRIVVQLPAVRLRGGVAFMDTPGLGSLATAGAAETLAYLPKCDLGVVLLDAGSPLTAEDLRLVRAFQEAAIPVDILLSKADLLSEKDRQTIVAYVKSQLSSELGGQFAVHPVSTVTSHRSLLDRWFDERIRPLYDEAQNLRAASLRRKIGLLSGSVIFALRSRTRDAGPAHAKDAALIRAAETRLRLAAGFIEETRALCERAIAVWTREPKEILLETARSLLAAVPEIRPEKPPVYPDILSVISRHVQIRATQIQSSLETLRSRLYDALEESARDLGIAEPPDAEEFRALVREMPVFDPRVGDVRIHRPLLSKVLGGRYAVSRMAKRIQSQLGESFQDDLRRYLELLRQWMERIAAQLGQQFELYAERYRADAASALGGHDWTPAERAAAEMNLKLLEEWPIRSPVELTAGIPGSKAKGGQ